MAAARAHGAGYLGPVAASTPPSAPRGRPFAGRDDLHAMEQCLVRSWQRARPLVNTTPGDLEWWASSASPDEDWSRRIRVWTTGGDVVAYAWLNPPGELDWHQRADLEPADRMAIVDETLAWLHETTDRRARAGEVEPPLLETWAMDADRELTGLLAARGWTPQPWPGYTHWYRRLDGPAGAALPDPVVPGGYRLRHVRLPDDLAARVEAHRAAFAPSRMTVETYRRVVAMPRYAPERDVVVEAPDGSIAAFALVWWTPEARVGELEPVGTHPDHQRRGLARAVNLAALRLLQSEGAIDALVFSRADNVASERLYASVGFEAVTRHRAWTWPGHTPGP